MQKQVDFIKIKQGFIIAGIESENDTCLVLSGILVKESIHSLPCNPKLVSKGVSDIVQHVIEA